MKKEKIIRKILKICILPFAIIIVFSRKWIGDLFDLMQEAIYDFESDWCSFECLVLNLWDDIKKSLSKGQK